jgi:uncharacterized protein YecE (DUF72 family)
MDFGIVENSELNNIDFTLPPDGEHTVALFKNHQKAGIPEVRIGLAKWGRKEWVGKLYPNRTKESVFLHEYTKIFNTIELNAVFYSIPSADLIGRWRQMVAEQHQHDFLFLPKFSRVISHIKRLNNVQQETQLFVETLKGFGSYLGPIFLQIGDNFGPKFFDTLKEFVENLPTDHRFFIELRQEDWFNDMEYRNMVFELFAKHRIGSIITDSAGRRDCLHMELTIPEAYIRFNGTDDKNRTIDFLRIDEWSDRVKTWVDKGLQKLYFIISQRDDSNTPELVQYAIQRFNEKLGSSIPEINWKADATETSVPSISGEEWVAYGLKLVKDDIENGRGDIVD